MICIDNFLKNLSLIKCFFFLFRINLTNNKSICSICLDNNCDIGLPCGHMFHLKCMMEWIKNKKSIECPNCRKNYNSYASNL